MLMDEEEHKHGGDTKGLRGVDAGMWMSRESRCERMVDEETRQ